MDVECERVSVAPPDEDEVDEEDVCVFAFDAGVFEVEDVAESPLFEVESSLYHFSTGWLPSIEFTGMFT